MNTFNLTLDLNKSRASSPVRLRQGDKSGTTISALILDHGATANLTGMTAQLVMELPDGTQYYRKSASVSGNVVTVVVDESTAASVPGRTANAYFQMLQGTTVKASTGSFAVEVLPDALEGHTVPESYDSAIQDAIDALDAAVENMPDTVEDVLADHPEWTTTVQDGSVSDAKLYQGTDGILARVQRLQYRLANMLTNALPEGETATATDAAKTPVAGLALYGSSTQDGTPTPSAPVAIQSVGGANITPFFSNPLNDNAYWFTTTNLQRYGTQLEDGWAHFVYSALNINVSPKIDAIAVKPNATYTVVLEVRNAVRCSDCSMYVYGGVNSAWATTANVPISGDGLYSITATTKADPYASDITHLRIFVGGITNDVDFDMRLALYEGTTAYPYVPYGNAGLWARRTSDASAYTVQPVPLDGHELRSLPDGTRDEVTVDERGHAVLVQRVGVTTITAFDGTNASGGRPYGYKTISGKSTDTTSNRLLSDKLTTTSGSSYYITNNPANVVVWGMSGQAQTDLGPAVLPLTVQYPLATPVTIDLGTIDPVPLVGPDLTAQAVPTAPMQLTYERDLNATLARLESAIATLA